MGHSQADKARSRERILEQAAEQIRDGGLESVSVGKLMRSANLTHGGFYGHFASRSELLVHALERALDDGKAAFEAKSGKATPDFAAVVRSYLSRTHREARTTGCAIAALAGDVARADEPAREAMSAHIERFIGRMDDALGGDDPDKAMFAVSAMIGALVVSRVLANDKRSDAVLAAAKRQLLALHGPE
ncbi:TetR/AcrR family transcriptional regulator [Cupriavidus consociatus]|uniref:TetR/AcrR family transcriptional regulator n=1 Tax=Cupriavidus consociatus TaxID=2821357 RepID=UPI001AEAA563|nr:MULTISPECIES: TetR/AcrR family transcriptional regulator [unclassified Cupriavidus]MBP0618909.1 TetR/AcrR family transcriptional regulator [Cupriavidus sp. LEh25]MDK2655552.1 TetR/AcrR family transcriptional regulator [Cupriavidus sp. LEh21]